MGTISDLDAMTGHGAGSVWAVANFTSGAASRLIEIRRIEGQVNDPSAWTRTAAILSGSALGYEHIVGMEEVDGVLYAVNAEPDGDGGFVNTLLTIDFTTTGMWPYAGGRGPTAISIEMAW